MRYRSACAASISAFVSASRTCSGPDRMSTIVGFNRAVAGSAVSAGGIDCCWTMLPAITRLCPVWGNGRSPATWPETARTDAAQTTTKRSFRIGSRLAATRNRIQLEAMSDQFIAKFIGDDLLQTFDILVAKLNHATRVQVDEMVVMCARHFLVAGSTIAEIVPGDDARLFEQPYRPVNRGNADARINRGCSSVDLFDIRVIGGFLSHPRHHPSLLGHL